MSQLIIKRHIRVIFATVFILFIVNKFAFRPLVLTNDTPQVLKIIAWSLPNFIEAIMGSILLTGGLFVLQIRFSAFLKSLKTRQVYLLAIFLAGVYVLTQEVKWHNLGGRNVYDPNDFIASIAGLLFIFVVFCKYGFKEQ